MEEIIVHSPVQGDLGSKHTLQSVISGDFFGAFVNSQKKSSTKLHGISAEGAVNLSRETAHILSHCNPHTAVTNSEATHLVVGYVQSGKTMSFTALTALALDNNYRIVIYFAGTKTNLLDQTTSRLRKDLVEGGEFFNEKYKIHRSPSKSDTEDIIGHLESTDKPIILIPVLKHPKHILNLVEVFRTDEMKEFLTNETVIIIDDEADQGSLNCYARKNSKEHENNLSSTYDAILQLRAVLPGNSYVQYTATPQANILISMQDMLSPQSHTLLTPGEGYVGGKKFFGKDANHELFNGGLIQEIPAKQVFHKKRNPLKSMPQSLKDALMFHILAVAIVVKWKKTKGVSYLSMMVHADETKVWNKKFKLWIDNELKNWRKALRKPDGQDDKVDLLERFELIFNEAIKFYSPEERPTFEQIRPFISDILNDKKVYLVNSDKDAETKIDWDSYKMHILVGAEMLNRGFTVEKLATTYMPRYATTSTNADTIEQRCRFFGYKMDFIKSCRVFLPKISIQNFYDYIEHEEELRNTLSTCDTLEAAERKILLSPRMRPTRENVLPIQVVNTQLKGMHGLQAFSGNSLIRANNQIVSEFLHMLESRFIENPITEFPLVYNSLHRTHRGVKISIDEAITFLSDFRFGNFKDSKRKAETIRYIRFLSNSSSNLHFVYFVQMAYDAPAGHRSFDYENLRLDESTDLFNGPSSKTDVVYYPGDRKICGDDSITIQLYHFHLDGVPLDFEKEAYTLAINYPDSLAVNYCANVESEESQDLVEQYNI